MKMPLVTLKQRQKEYSTTFDIWLIIYRVPCFRLQYGTTFDWGWLMAICIVVVTDRMINCLYLRKMLRKRWWFNFITKMYVMIEFWELKSISLYFRRTRHHDLLNLCFKKITVLYLLPRLAFYGMNIKKLTPMKTDFLIITITSNIIMITKWYIATYAQILTK